MSVNNMNFEQAATLLNAVHSQVTGKTQIAPADVSEFISVAQKTLKMGYDPVLNAISQVVGRTIFSMRPYSAKFGGIQADAQKWGSITRKLVLADKPLEDNQAFNLVDGQSIDMYAVNKPQALQVNFYGALEYSKSFTIFRSQLDNAFKGPDEFGRFMAMVTQNALDMIEQTKETCARLTLDNFIAGKIAANNGVIHLLTEYNQDVGGSYTATTIKEAANWKEFVKWVYARIATLTGLMTERSEEYQIKVTGYDINRHTPFEDQKVYLFADILNAIDARVLADTYNYKFIEYADVEPVGFWQSIETRDRIQIKPTYLQADGTLTTSENPITQANIMGVIFDDEALGYTTFNEFSGVTPMNVRGEYWNQYFNYVIRYWNDFTEKGLVLLLD